MLNLNVCGVFAFGVLLLSAFPAQAGTSTVQVLSAVIKDQKIAGATVILQKNGEPSTTATTDNQGNANVIANFPDTEETLLIVKKNGYSTLVVKCPCSGMSYAVSPVMTSLDGLRAVLNWGSNPPDLDLHLAFPGNHIFFDAKDGSGGPSVNANLDVDQINGFGPETITVNKKHVGESYVFAVHDFTNRSEPGKLALSQSGAKVLIYIGQSLVRSYYVPANTPGNLWTIFRVTADGEFQDINTVTNTTVDAETVLGQVNSYTNNNTRVETHVASAAATQSATDLNRNGEKAYHAGDIEGSANLFRQAIDSDPNYGQAYGNLGLTYQKLNRTSEAIWANRKAIALASGATAPTVRAGSYYNIARIYEAAGQNNDALQNYELAKEQKDNPVYDKAIERVRALAQ